MSTRKSIQAMGAPAPAERPARATGATQATRAAAERPARAGTARAPRVLAPTLAPMPTPTPQRRRADAALQPTGPVLAPAAAAHPPQRQRFGDLRAALAEGWEIVQPIFARPLWSVPDDSKTAFNFVLAHAESMRLVTVPEGRTVERFIRARQLTVDYAHP